MCVASWFIVLRSLSIQPNFSIFARARTSTAGAEVLLTVPAHVQKIKFAMPAPIMELVNDKIMSLTEMYNRRNSWGPYDQLTVFTNGVFDIIHPGHLTYLAEARAIGDRLIVGLNSDESVRRLKGANRPIMPQAARAQLLASLFFVDGVILFEEDTPLELIKYLKPDVLVKGGDYTEDQIVGAQEVKAYGGEVRILDFVEGYSSSRIIGQIQAQ